MIIGTAGHIDHGKTSVVRALTGVDTDRLKEEKARGISIELGYAYRELPSGEVMGFIDVPGHEKLIHTMVAGAGGIDFALLVIAADDGIMPQSREHLAILQLLGISRGAVALTKVDRATDERVRGVRSAIAAWLAPTTLRAAPIFSIDAGAINDVGVDALRAHLESVAESHPRRDCGGLFRLAVDRVFTLPGRGTIVTGTVCAGQVNVGDTLEVLPARTAVRVRSIHAQNRETTVGRAGQRCALNLTGIDKAAVSRGDWVADARALRPSVRIDVRLRWLQEEAALAANRRSLHVHVGTTDAIAALLSLSDVAGADGTFYVQCVFEQPVCVASGDPLIVRDAQASRTLGGGVVLDPVAPARRRRGAQRLAYLDALGSLLDGHGLTRLLAAAPHGIPLGELERLCGRAAQQLTLPLTARIIAAGGESVVFDAATWNAMREAALATLLRFHAQHPDEPGIDRGRLRRMIMPALADSIWRELIRELIESRCLSMSAHWLHLPTHRLRLGAADQRLADTLDSVIAADGFEPKWVRDLALRVGASEQAVRKILLTRVTQGAAYQIVRDLFCNQSSVREWSAVLRTVASRDGVVQAAEYRDAIGVGRKRAIQILEFFDRVGYTRRTRDARVLRPDSNWHDSV